MEVSTKTILIGRCRHDPRVKYPFYWMERVISEARKLGFDVIDLKDDKFDNERLKRLLYTKQPFMVILCGHGDGYSVSGHDDQKVMELCNEDYLLKNKIVYMISCSTFNELGKSARTKGCKCFIGWDIPLAVSVKTNDPEQDDYAQPCLEAITQLPISILKGKSVEDAYDDCYEKFTEWIERWRSDIRFTIMASALEDMRDHLSIDPR